MPNTRPDVERKIYFYRANAGVENNGRRKLFRLAQVLDRLDALSFDSGDNYLQFADGNATCCWIDRKQPHQRLRFGLSRRVGLPQLETTGRVTALRIAAAAGLVEQIHVIFFPNSIVGSDFNFHGPRMGRLSYYICNKAPDVCDYLEFEPLLRQNVMQQVQRLQDIRLFDLRVRTSYADTLRTADEDLFSAIDVARRLGEAAEMQIILRPPPRSHQTLSNRLLGVVKTLASRQDIREQAEKFQVKGFDPTTESVELVDILSDQLISRKRIVLLNSRTRALAGCGKTSISHLENV
jgi:hypothetical protein